MAQFYPSGMLGVGLTALMASFMSGMAGNVTAFNTVFTYDIYQSYIRPGAPDRHYLTVGRMTTLVGTALSIATAYLAQHYNNIMDLLQLVFGFVNAPLFATFLLGMFWKRTTGHGAFTGLLAGTSAAALVHGLTACGRKGRLDWDHVYVSFHHGAKLLDRDFCLDDLLRRYGSGQPRDIAQAGSGTGRVGLWLNRSAPGERCALVPPPSSACFCGMCRADTVEHLVPLMLDLRIPSGAFFAIIGLVLCGMGLVSPENRAPLTTTNINLVAGAVMLAFGIVLLLLSRRRA